MNMEREGNKMKSTRREMEKKSEIGLVIEELSMIAIVKPGENHDSAHIPTKLFLSICYLVLQVLDKIGPTMAVLRQDTLELMQESNPSLHSNLVEILKSEATEGNSWKGSSCSKALVWLTRTLDFTSLLLQTLANDPEKRMEQIVEEAYDVTLKPWHGWISSTAFRVALKLVPESKTFVNILKTEDENYDTLKEKMQMLVSLFVPFLEDMHCILRLYNLDKLKST
ncbi:Pleckstrin likey domain-containing family A member 8 [Glycine soja]|uniref:Pleckstrin likey domain-containing family A member 8 n=1 Tax=Glycine soja TaxID=3848 RepID=A0A0B2PIR7_GLYSO|nr:Pleckstrin likey domain-containing family A member 8 [Glycine soja]